MLLGLGRAPDTPAGTSSTAPPMTPLAWQTAHCASLVITPPECTRRPGGACGGEPPALTETKLTSSWHEPHARRVGIFQLLAIGAGLVADGFRWHLVQLRMSCG